MRPRNAIADAIAAWTDLLGAENVLADEGVLSDYARCTAPHSSRPSAILRPGSTAEVQTVVNIARRNGVPLYPISGGKNWGLGSACAVTDRQVIVDLRRMNRIHEVNEPLAYAVIEPGVTQGQLYEHLQRLGGRLWFDATGAGPSATVIGNLMERGYGHTPLADRFQNACGFEVVLADGRVVELGSGHYSTSRTRDVFKPGIGPSLDGLFTQSNLGIVTRATIWLMPRPEYFQAFAFTLDEPQQLGALVEALRPLKMQGIVPSAVHIANDLRVISAHRRFPRDREPGSVLSADLRREYRQARALGAWNVLGGLYGTKQTVRASRRELQRALRGLARPRFLDDAKLRLAEYACRLGRPLGLGLSLGQQLASIRSAYGLLKGEPAADHLAGMAWRARCAPPQPIVDPLAGNFGFAWLSAVVPMTREAALELQQLVEPVFARYQFDPLVTYVAISPRALACPITVCFDKQDPEEARRAAACYDALFDAVMSRGFIPYRSSIGSMSRLADGSRVFWDVVDQLKIALDANRILAPGRYEPSPARNPIPADDVISKPPVRDLGWAAMSTSPQARN